MKNNSSIRSISVPNILADQKKLDAIKDNAGVTFLKTALMDESQM